MRRLLLFCLAFPVISQTPAVLGDDSDLTGSDVLTFDIVRDSDDGTEVDRRLWRPSGYGDADLNRMGRAGDEQYDVGLRFSVPQLSQGEKFAYARMILSGTGGGLVESGVKLHIVGIDQDSVTDFSISRPSRQPKTQSYVEWNISSNWPDTISPDHGPLLRYSSDIAPIINEILARPRWGQEQPEKTLGLVIQDSNSGDHDYLTIEDFDGESPYDPYQAVPPVLELYRTISSTFLGKELLGRPTDHSITINAMSLLALDVYIEYGTTPGVYAQYTAIQGRPGGTPFEIILDDLSPNTAYHYRMRYRRVGETSFQTGLPRSFHTQRPPGETFCFTIQSDSHIWEAMRQVVPPELYRHTLANIAADSPDFHIALGDTFLCEDYAGGDVLDFEDAMVRHLSQRAFLDIVCHSSPFFVLLGNHEGEQGWRLDGTPDNVAVWATTARKLLYPNPVPDGFYTGCEEESEFVGLPENYYAFEWGDALFVMLDPYRYTTVKPHSAGGSPGSDDNWDWTLGFAQYNWLRQTLQNSGATFKFVFAHQVTGGADLYGRGGVEAAIHGLAHPGSFEWGGEDLSGWYAFDLERPFWGVPVHQLMVDNGVSIFFHGHDHVFVKQALDGVIYQECPTPSDGMYGYGHYGYMYGDVVNNSGHLRVTVSPGEVTVSYVRAYLPGDGLDGEISYSYRVSVFGP